MKRILVISDIHANLTALEAVIKDAAEVDAVWCLGDLVGYGPDPNPCVNRIRKLPNVVCVIGNHDAAALGQIDLQAFNRDARQSAEWMIGELSATNLKFLSNLPESLVIDDVTLAHGSPRNPVWEYLLDPYTAATNFAYFETPFCFTGHTHLPVAYEMQNGSLSVDWNLLKHGQNLVMNERTIINPGSVGQPRDHDPRASYAIYYPDTRIWEPHRVEYNIAAVQARILAAGLPKRHAARLEQGW
jgi:diadenosine tetraphosphatase ApaH/serine/threonine PP2A family protein phosphatase